MVEIRFKGVNRHDHPVGVAAVTALNGWFWRPNDGFLSKRYNFVREVG